jgi:hypothetical protein
LRQINLILIEVAFLAYLVAFGRERLSAIWFFFPYTMTPFVVTGLLAVIWRGFWTQVVLLVTTLAYAAWFAYVYVHAMILNLDPQSPIAFLFVGIYAAPFLVVLWLIAYALEWAYGPAETPR